MTNLVAWICLILAIFAEVAGTTSMKLSEGFTYLRPSIFIFVFYAMSLGFLTLSLKKMEVGFAYAVWSGLGTFLIFFIGVEFFNESVNTLKVISLILIIVGVIGLKQA